MSKTRFISPLAALFFPLGIAALLAGCSKQADTSTAPEDTAADRPATYTNPVIWQDLPDTEVIRVNDTYYYTASSFHHSPGAPLLRSYDLVNWEFVSHSVPRLDFDPAYDLEGKGAYVKGIWASTLQYRKSNETFYWMGCMHDIGGGYVFTAENPEGPWQQHESQNCYYDMGLLVDDDDTMYVAWGHGEISVAELSPDGLSEVRRQQVLETPDWVTGPLEGARFKKINDDYYIFLTQYANGEYVLRSTEGPFGPYELRPFAVSLPFGREDAGIAPHQGGLVETQHGDWYYMAFNDSFPGGRIPVMAPVTWQDGWPEVTLVNGEWGASYPFPDLPNGENKISPYPDMERFTTPELGPVWEWNHNPDNSKWSAGEGLVLHTASVTDDLFLAKNTLTRRIEGPRSSATIKLDYSAMQNGDVAGLAAFRDVAAWIGIKKRDDRTEVVMSQGQALNLEWETESLGAEVETREVSGGTIWLRMEADITTVESGGTAKFFWSDDGSEFHPVGETFPMERRWNYFLGYRFALFNYASESLGGKVTVEYFEVTR